VRRGETGKLKHEAIKTYSTGVCGVTNSSQRGVTSHWMTLYEKQISCRGSTGRYLFRGHKNPHSWFSLLRFRSSSELCEAAEARLQGGGRHNCVNGHEKQRRVSTLRSGRSYQKPPHPTTTKTTTKKKIREKSPTTTKPQDPGQD